MEANGVSADVGVLIKQKTGSLLGENQQKTDGTSNR